MKKIRCSNQFLHFFVRVPLQLQFVKLKLRENYHYYQVYGISCLDQSLSEHGSCPCQSVGRYVQQPSAYHGNYGATVVQIRVLQCHQTL